MMTKTADDMVEAYLRRLDAELRALPRARRSELVGEIREHIEEARADLPTQSGVELRNLLERLGEPAAIASEARERFGIRPARAGAAEIFALILLSIGGVILPIVGWFVGLVLLWTSKVWTRRDKWIGTLVVPGGLALSFYLAVVAPGRAACVTSGGSGRGLQTTCGGGIEIAQLLIAAGVVILFLAPIATRAYLLTRLRRSTRAAALEA